MRPEHRAAICRVEVGGSVGTGALVAPGLVLTALHVVADRKAEVVPLTGPISLTFPEGAVPATLLTGRWSLDHDWALLKIDVPVSASPLPLANASDSGVTFETCGYPEAQPVDGMVLAGTIRDHAGRYMGFPAMQLFSDEAAAGQGTPVRGLSGAPVLVDGAVVGVMRSSLMKEGRNVAGTLYATPVQLAAEAAPDLLPWPDPCVGLPGVPSALMLVLPTQPYRHLAPYGPAEAALLAGRCREIRALLGLVEGPGAPMLVVHGPTGVGKSSLLQAGLLPRLKGPSRYARRSAEGLLADLRALLGCAEGAELRTWKALEADGTLHIVLDQVEEAWTHPLADANELGELLAVVAPALTGPDRPRGRLILSLRKEWEPDLRQRLETWQGLSWSTYGVQRLDRAAIIEVVESIPRNKTLQSHYRLQVEPGLSARIADDLLSDPDSPVAPLLQILLTRLLEGAAPDVDGNRNFTAAAYTKLRREGLYLGDFLERQLAELGRRLPEALRSGLALDLLAFQVGPQLTSLNRTRDDLLVTYATQASPSELRPEVARTLALAKDLYLLSDAADGGSRLAHDTLAPIVRSAFDRSRAPGQRARALLESLANVPDAVLDRAELRVVDEGASGMRTRTAEEEARVAAARAQLRTAERQRTIAVVGAGVLALLLVAALVQGWNAGRKRQQAEAARERESAMRVNAEIGLNIHEARLAWEQASLLWREGEPLALTWASYALDRASSQDPMKLTYAAGVTAMALQAPIRVLALAGDARPEVSPSGRWLACGAAGAVEIWSGLLGSRLSRDGIATVSGVNQLSVLRFSPDEQRLSVGRDFGDTPVQCSAPGLTDCAPGEAILEDHVPALQQSLYDQIFGGLIEDAVLADDGRRGALLSSGAIIGVDRQERRLTGRWLIGPDSRLLRIQPDAGWFATVSSGPRRRGTALRIWSMDDPLERAAMSAAPNRTAVGGAPLPCGPGMTVEIARYDGMLVHAETPRGEGAVGGLQWPAAHVLAEACRVATEPRASFLPPEAGSDAWQLARDAATLELTLPGGLTVSSSPPGLKLSLGDSSWNLMLPRSEQQHESVAVAIHPTGELLALSGAETLPVLQNGVTAPDAVVVYSTRSGERVAGPLWMPAPVASLAFSADGTTLRLVDQEGHARSVVVLPSNPRELSAIGAEVTGWEIDQGSLKPVEGQAASPTLAFLRTLQRSSDPALTAIYHHLTEHLDTGTLDANPRETRAPSGGRAVCFTKATP